YRFGFGEPTGLPINHESAGRVPTKEWHRKHGPDGYQYGFALNTVIGQGDTLTSPLQVALAYAAIANGGDLYYPRLIEQVRARTGEVLFEFPPRRRKRVEMDPKHLEEIRDGLERTVEHEHGTAYASRIEDVRVAGKTGTAQVHKIGRVRVANRDKEFRFRDHAWFASYAPAQDPELVLVVFLQHGGHGGSDAAPVAKAIYDAYLHRDGARPLTQRVSALAARRSALERAQSERADADQADPEPERAVEEGDDGAQ
ncbi:MAG: penicillin-binding transpeptidase domain-containing protein, partial [Myxococcota bacterium]